MGTGSVDNPRIIGAYRYVRYGDLEDAFCPYDERLPAVAAVVISLIQGLLPYAAIEHVGSSAIPGCDGKGVVDLMVSYEPGRLTAVCGALEQLGFQRHLGPNAHPDDRPAFVGSIDYEGESFRLHVHVIAEGASEIVDQRHFRDTLRADPDLVAEYVAVKREALTQGVRDSREYNDRKDSFIKRVMASGR